MLIKASKQTHDRPENKISTHSASKIQTQLSSAGTDFKGTAILKSEGTHCLLSWQIHGLQVGKNHISPQSPAAVAARGRSQCGATTELSKAQDKDMAMDRYRLVQLEACKTWGWGASSRKTERNCITIAHFTKAHDPVSTW